MISFGNAPCRFDPMRMPPYDDLKEMKRQLPMPKKYKAKAFNKKTGKEEVVRVLNSEEFIQRDHALPETSAAMLKVPRKPLKKRDFVDGDLYRRHKLLRKEYLVEEGIRYQIGDVVLLLTESRENIIGRIISFYQNGTRWKAELELFWVKGPQRSFTLQLDPPQLGNEILYDPTQVLGVPVTSFLSILDVSYYTQEPVIRLNSKRIDTQAPFYCWRKVIYVGVGVLAVAC